MKYEELTDKYFIRSKEILEKEEINPFVKYQVFCRKSVEMPNMEDIQSFLMKHSGPDTILKYQGEGNPIKSGEVFLEYFAPVQDIIDLETVLLGKLSSAFTGELTDEDFKTIEKNAADIVNAAEGKPVFYFGARHFDPKHDSEIGKICAESGFVGASTDNAAKWFNSTGVGTIPHALILSVYSDIMEKEQFGVNPTVKTTELFDKHMPKEVPRIALIDTFNREISDSIETATKIHGLNGVRIDTCGENFAQISKPINPAKKYYKGKGVTIEAVHNLRQTLPKEIKITVSSGFNANKTKAFIEASKIYEGKRCIPLFDNIGTGSLLPKAVMTTSDIVSYFSKRHNSWKPLSKVGRNERTCNW